MDVLNGLIFPVASVFYDLYMVIVIPGMATISDLAASGSYVIEYFNPFTQVQHSFVLPNLIESIIEILDFGLAGTITANFGDVTLFALLVLGVGLSFFVILLVKLIAILTAQD